MGPSKTALVGVPLGATLHTPFFEPLSMMKVIVVDEGPVWATRVFWQ